METKNLPKTLDMPRFSTNLIKYPRLHVDGLPTIPNFNDSRACYVRKSILGCEISSRSNMAAPMQHET